MPETQVPRKSERHRRRSPVYDGEWEKAACIDRNEPTTINEALSSPENAKWVKAMEKEMEVLFLEVWHLLELPENRKAVGSKWVFPVKTDARLLAQGFS